jgi:hypothetical protein
MRKSHPRFNGNTRIKQTSLPVLADRPMRITKRDGSRSKQMVDIVKLDNNRIVRMYLVCHVVDKQEVEITEDKNKKTKSSKVIRIINTRTSWEFIFKMETPTDDVNVSASQKSEVAQTGNDGLSLHTHEILPKSIEEDALTFWLETNHADAWMKEVLAHARTLSRNRNSIAPYYGR